MNIDIVTHDGKFHPDEIFASVLLMWWKCLEKPKFKRTRNEQALARYKSNENTFVIDVGGEYNPDKLNFDHHQASFTDLGENGDRLSSCGLLWKYVLEQEDFRRVCYITEFIEKKVTEFTIRVDRHDNGDEYFPELDFITMFNYANLKPNDKFREAFKAAEKYFHQKVYMWRLEEEAELKAEKAIEEAQDGIIFVDGKISINEKMNCSPNYLVVSERTKDEWCITSLNQWDKVDFSVRCPAPKEWAGLSNADIQKFDKNLIFCHKNLFLSIVKGTKDDAIRVANFIISEHRRIKKEKALDFIAEIRDGFLDELQKDK